MPFSTAFFAFKAFALTFAWEGEGASFFALGTISWKLSTGEFYQIFKEVYLSFSNCNKKIQEEERLTSSYYKGTIILIPKSDKEIKVWPNNPDVYRCKYPQENISKSNKKILSYDQGGFIPGVHGWINIHKSINMTHHINKMKSKNYMIVSIDAEKAFDKT